jgi:hypothetical protein
VLLIHGTPDAAFIYPPAQDANAQVPLLSVFSVRHYFLHEEIAARSAIGYYLFSPSGENERLLETTAFRLSNVCDTTANA